MSLFDKNLSAFSTAIANSKHPTDIDIDLARQIARQSTPIVPENYWTPSRNNIILLPQLLTVNEPYTALLRDMVSKYSIGSNCNQYINDHEDDPHFASINLDLHHKLIELGANPFKVSTIVSSIRPFYFIVTATGSGNELLSILQHLQPYNLVIAVHDWHDFASSFWEIDWTDISEKYHSSPHHSLSIGFYDEPESVVHSLLAQCHTGLDHTFVYSPLLATQKVKDFSQSLLNTDVVNSVLYLGFQQDEYNMVYNAFNALSNTPKIFANSKSLINCPFIVCGSGPSLDSSLDYIAKLQHTHVIVASGSNYRTLRSHGISVDILAMVERDEVLVQDYSDVISTYGSDQAILIASVTCQVGLQSLFDKSVLFFRPALTPLAVFSERVEEIINFEGPQSVNTGVSIACSLGASKVILVGIDLGTRSLDYRRSKFAAGEFHRDFPDERPANFGGLMFTNKIMLDSASAISSCSSVSKDIQIFNASDGLFIENTIPLRLDEYTNDYTSIVNHFDKHSLICDWFDELNYFSSERLNALWNSRSPRKYTSLFFQKLRLLYMTPSPWRSSFILDHHKIMSLDVGLSHQFPIRLVRATFTKIVIAIDRQLTVLSTDSKLRQAFEDEARQILVDYTYKFEAEIYSLCDLLESI